AARKSIACAVPIRRLNSLRVFRGSVSRKRRARAPTVTAPRASMRTTEGVSVAPCELRTSVTFSPSNTAAVEVVVPRSMPTERGPDAIALKDTQEPAGRPFRARYARAFEACAGCPGGVKRSGARAPDTPSSGVLFAGRDVELDGHRARLDEPRVRELRID